MEETAFKEFFLNENRNKLIMEFGFQIIQSIIVIIVGLLLIKFIAKAINKMAETKNNEGKSATMMTVLKSFTKYAVYFVMFFQILVIFNIRIESFLAVAGIGSVAIGFGAQYLVADIITGLFILMEDQFGVGDIISVKGLIGTVESIGVRTIRLRSIDGDVHIIPNSEIKIVTNMSKGFNRAIIDISISHEEDIDKVIKILEDRMKTVADTLANITQEPKILGITEIGEYSVTVRIIADCKAGEKWSCERELRKIIKLCLKEKGIQIPYPHKIIRLENDKET